MQQVKYIFPYSILCIFTQNNFLTFVFYIDLNSLSPSSTFSSLLLLDFPTHIKLYLQLIYVKNNLIPIEYG